MEEKLIKLMGPEEYSEFAKAIAKEAFKAEINGMADGDFKTFVIENIDQITE